MDKIIRCITSDGAVMASAIDASDIVFTAKKLHHLSKSATAALGRLLCATSIMGAMLKQKDATINLRVMGDGELGPVIAVGDSKGNVKGYVGNSNCPTEFYNSGKINVAKAVGKNGVLNVMRDYGTGEPYIGQVELVSGEIAEDITNYYATSEQIPTVCALGVLVDRETKEVMLSGGLLIQVLPGAIEADIALLEQNIAKLDSMTTMLAKGMTLEEIVNTALEGFDVEKLDETDIHYACTCSKEKYSRALLTLGEKEILSLPQDDGMVEAVCPYCSKHYYFSQKEIEELAAVAAAKNEA